MTLQEYVESLRQVTATGRWKLPLRSCLTLSAKRARLPLFDLTAAHVSPIKTRPGLHSMHTRDTSLSLIVVPTHLQGCVSLAAARLA